MILTDAGGLVTLGIELHKSRGSAQAGTHEADADGMAFCKSDLEFIFCHSIWDMQHKNDIPRPRS
jgi:hypothetical protein